MGVFPSFLSLSARSAGVSLRKPSFLGFFGLTFFSSSFSFLPPFESSSRDLDLNRFGHNWRRVPQLSS
jgi:hypothetical protein